MTNPISPGPGELDVKRAKETSVSERKDEFVDLSETFIAHPLSRTSGEKASKSAPLSLVPCVPKQSVSREQLIFEQRNDSSLSPVLTDAVSKKNTLSLRRWATLFERES